MTVPVRLAAFTALLVVLGLAGFGVGRLAGPLDDAPPAHSATASAMTR
jgi:hypothetical protein